MNNPETQVDMVNAELNQRKKHSQRELTSLIQIITNLKGQEESRREKSQQLMDVYLQKQDKKIMDMLSRLIVRKSMFDQVRNQLSQMQEISKRQIQQLKSNELQLSGRIKQLQQSRQNLQLRYNFQQHYASQRQNYCRAARCTLQRNQRQNSDLRLQISRLVADKQQLTIELQSRETQIYQILQINEAIDRSRYTAQQENNNLKERVLILEEKNRQGAQQIKEDFEVIRRLAGEKAALEAKL